MSWSIKTSLFFLFSLNRALLFSAFVPTPLSKMDVLSVNIATFLTLYVPFFFLPPTLRNFGVRLLLHPCTINRLHSFILQNISSFKRLYGTPLNYFNLKVFRCVCFVLLFILTNTLNSNHVLASAAFLDMTQNISPCDLFGAYSVLSSSLFHTFFSSSHIFFIDKSIDLFPLSEFTPETDLLNLHLLLQARTNHLPLMMFWSLH